MNQYDFKEFRILRCPHRAKHGNLTMMIEIQEIDAPLALELYYRDCWQHGVMLRAEIDEIESEVEIENKKASITSVKMTSSIYQEFKWFCERNGKDYEKEKIYISQCYLPPYKYLDHMKDLEKYFSPPEIENILNNRMAEIKEELGFYSETN